MFLEATSDTLSSILGPTSLIIQGGSFALLAYIVVRVSLGLPKAIDRYNAMREKEALSREKVAEELRKAVEIQASSNVIANKEALKAYREENKYEREQCDKRFQELASQVLEVHTVVRETRHEVANIANNRALDKAKQEEVIKKEKHEKSRMEGK